MEPKSPVDLVASVAPVTVMNSEAPMAQNCYLVYKHILPTVVVLGRVFIHDHPGGNSSWGDFRLDGDTS